VPAELFRLSFHVALVFSPRRPTTLREWPGAGGVKLKVAGPTTTGTLAGGCPARASVWMLSGTASAAHVPSASARSGSR
jgi:hypothetical protein